MKNVLDYFLRAVVLVCIGLNLTNCAAPQYWMQGVTSSWNPKTGSGPDKKTFKVIVFPAELGQESSLPSDLVNMAQRDVQMQLARIKNFKMMNLFEAKKLFDDMRLGTELRPSKDRAIKEAVRMGYDLIVFTEIRTQPVDAGRPFLCQVTIIDTDPKSETYKMDVYQGRSRLAFAKADQLEKNINTIVQGALFQFLYDVNKIMSTVEGALKTLAKKMAVPWPF
jgi:hypothetical protein